MQKEYVRIYIKKYRRKFSRTKDIYLKKKFYFQFLNSQ